MTASRVNAVPKHDRRPQPKIAAVERERRGWRITTVVVSILALILLFGLVGFQALIVRNQSTLDDLDAQIDDASRVNQRLRLQVAELEAPERIRAKATINLGMIEPETVLYLEPISAATLHPEGSE
jgi:cell division protein FtsL